MAKKTRMRIDFPLGGLNRRSSYRQQKPYTTVDCLNVRPVGGIENRLRGGSRPGMVQSHTVTSYTYSSNDWPHDVGVMTLSSQDNFRSWSDTFLGESSSLSSEWVQASWVSATPTILPSERAASAVAADGPTAVMKVGESANNPTGSWGRYDYIDTSKWYIVEMRFLPKDGEHHGTYRLFLRLDSRTADITVDGVIIELVPTETTGTFTRNVHVYKDSELTTYTGTINFDAAIPVHMKCRVVGNQLRVHFGDETKRTYNISSHTGNAVGFGIEGNDTTECLVDWFRVQYYSKNIEAATAARTVVYSLGGAKTNIEQFHGHIKDTASTKYLNRFEIQINSTQVGQKLYIANFADRRATYTDGVISGLQLSSASVSDFVNTEEASIYRHIVILTDVTGATVEGTYEIDSVGASIITLKTAPGDGNCSFSIEAGGPLVVDMESQIGTPAPQTVTTLMPTAGLVPRGCPLICRYLDRLVLAGASDANHVWYASRQGDVTDWDYAQTDSQRAVAGTASAAGIPGTAITALVPHSDDYLIIGCYDSIWRMRGDPAYGRGLDALSRVVGILGGRSWCLGPEGELIFLSPLGLYILPAGGDAAPIPISRKSLPKEFIGIDPQTIIASLEYDVRNNGIFIFLTPISENEERVHWWLDWETKTFWPFSMYKDHEPIATCNLVSSAAEDSGVILLCRDGELRRFDTVAEYDEGRSFASHIDIGPIALARDGSSGMLFSVDASMGEGSGDVTWGVYPALTFEAAASAGTASETGTWVAGLNARVRPVGRGQAFKLRITGSSANRKWSMEQIVISVKESGQRRIA